PISDVEINVYDWTRELLVRSVTSDPEGYAAFLMSGDRKYGITASKSDFNLASISRTIGSDIGGDVIDTLRLVPATNSNTMILENVHFATGEARLLEGSTTE